MRVIVVGSANADTTWRVHHLPRPGETIPALSVDQHGGGKGANIAYAAAAGSSDVVLVACVGADANAELALSDLEAAGVSLEYVRRSDTPTGTAVILVDSAGENSIIVNAGANGAWTSREAANTLDSLSLAEAVIVTNFEVPDSVSLAAAQAATGGTRLVVNPSPLAPLSPELVACHPLIVVNAHEAMALSAMFGAVSEQPEAAARAIAAHTQAPVVVTLGAHGVGILDQEWTTVPARPVHVVDTTGAGDAFLGAMAARLGTGSLFDAVKTATESAARVVQTPGARTRHGR